MFERVFMGLIMGSQNIMGSDYGSNISVVNNQMLTYTHPSLFIGRGWC